MAQIPLVGPGGALPPSPGSVPGAKPAAPADRSFGEALVQALDKVEAGQAEAGAAVRDHLSGKGTDLHTVMLELEKADLAFRTMMEVRNKLIDAYREVMRMPM